MERNTNSFKAIINNIARKNKIASQAVLQTYMLERLLERISISKYRDNFILKGGFLISSMIGISERTTMDMDTTITGINMEEDELERVIREILLIDVGDGIKFEFEKFEIIREKDDYNNFRAFLVAHYGKIANKVKVDITTGDEITPGAVRYSYKTILDDDEINIKAYNIETIIAEKYETIIRRNIGTSRARDFYDLYMFYHMYKESIHPEMLKLAVTRTAKKRESLQTMLEWKEIIEDMREDTALKVLWNNYCVNNTYAEEASYEDVMEILLRIAELLEF